MGRPQGKKAQSTKRERRQKAGKKKVPQVPSGIQGSVFALDPSSAMVGWALFVDGEPTAYGKYEPEGGLGAKLNGYRNWLLHMLAMYQPDVLVVEVPYQNPKYKNTYGLLMMFFGVALSCHAQHFGDEMPDHHRLHPSSIKATLGAQGTKMTHAQRKERMVCYMNEIYGLGLRYKKGSKKSEDDIADALAAGRAWLIRHGAPNDPI